MVDTSVVMRHSLTNTVEGCHHSNTNATPSLQAQTWNIQHAGYQFELRRNVRYQLIATLKSAPLPTLCHHTNKFTPFSIAEKESRLPGPWQSLATACHLDTMLPPIATNLTNNTIVETIISMPNATSAPPARQSGPPCVITNYHSMPTLDKDNKHQQANASCMQARSTPIYLLLQLHIGRIMQRTM